MSSEYVLIVLKMEIALEHFKLNKALYKIRLLLLLLKLLLLLLLLL